MVVMTTRARGVVPVVALALAASLLTLAVVLAKPAQAQAQTDHFNERVPIAFVVPNPCTGELITVEGTQHFVFNSTVTENGMFHFQGHSNIQLQGVSESGAKYVLHQTQNSHSNFDVFSDSADNFTSTTTLQFIRQGSETAEDDFQQKVLVHVTINANGDLTSEVSTLEIECK
jgi:hypothetical protein